MNVLWQWNKQPPWLVTLIAGQGHAYPGHHSKEEEIKPYVQKGVTECKTARQEERDYLIHRVSQIFPRRQFLDESRCCCFCEARWSARAGCYVFTLSCSFIVQLVTCEVWFSQLLTTFPCTVCWQTSKQPLLSLVWAACLTAPNPPSTPTPLQLQSCSERDPTQKFGRGDQMVVVFAEHSSFACIGMNKNNTFFQLFG